MEGVKKTEIKNLVLSVSRNYNRANLNLDDWDDFLDALTAGRSYQKEALQIALIYLASGKYSSINELASENYKNSSEMQEEYSTETKFIQSLKLPNILSGVIDLATGTGKSYIIFGIAYILLSIGFIKRVLVLCPSTTIESGLTSKFIDLLTRNDLQSATPSQFRNAIRIVDANQTIREGDICIENIHAVYANTGSSIKDSFFMKGSDTLILSDEVHHAYNSTTDNDIRKWLEFISDKTYGFQYHIGFTGTAYCDNTYFSDVIYKYSLRQAIADRIVKEIEYVDEDDAKNDDYEKFQKIYQNHRKNQIKYSSIKPLTIIVTKDIKSAKILHEDLINYLVMESKQGIEVIEKKVLIVTSHADHKKNIAKLNDVDNADDPTEWIISVSMLTEGWDVKNVFQIVPWEDRAFNSKLLISQVLGRGLRITKEYPNSSIVRVYNHSSWAKNIRKIVDEILESEKSITSRILTTSDRAKNNFIVHNLDYTKEERPEFNNEYDEKETFDISKPLELLTQEGQITKTTKYISTSAKTDEVDYLIKRETITVEELAKKIADQYKSRQIEAKVRNMQDSLVFNDGTTEMDRLPNYEEIVNYIRKSMQLSGINGNELTEANVLKINGKFNGLLRKKRKSAGFANKANKPIEKLTTEMSSASDKYSSVKNGMTIFYSADYKNELEQEEIEVLDFFLEEIKGKQGKIINSYDFKTPASIVLANKEPETKFIELLIDKAVAQKIDTWIKSRDIGFYSINYLLKRGASPKEFNPDFFIKVGDNIIVIETKSDNDISKENASKLMDAKKHFTLLNEKLEEDNSTVRYFFNILSPSSYPDFKIKLIDGTYFNGGFNSAIELALKEQFPNKDA